MKKQILMFAALLIVSLAALAQGQKRFNLYAGLMPSWLRKESSQ